MGLRARVAEGWYSFVACWVRVGRVKDGDDALSEKIGAACDGWDGEFSGELLASEERSEELWMETN